MKKILFIVLSLLLIFAMTACGGDKKEDASKDATKTESPYASMQQGEEPLEIYEGTSTDIGEIGSVEPTKEMLQELKAAFDDMDRKITYAEVTDIMGCHGEMRPNDDGDYEYIGYDWEHENTNVRLAVTFNVQDDGSYKMSGQSTVE